MCDRQKEREGERWCEGRQSLTWQAAASCLDSQHSSARARERTHARTINAITPLSGRSCAERRAAGADLQASPSLSHPPQSVCLDWANPSEAPLSCLRRDARSAVPTPARDSKSQFPHYPPRRTYGKREGERAGEHWRGGGIEINGGEKRPKMPDVGFLSNEKMRPTDRQATFSNSLLAE